MLSSRTDAVEWAERAAAATLPGTPAHAVALINLGSTLTDEPGRREEGRRALREAVALTRVAGREFDRARALNNLLSEVIYTDDAADVLALIDEAEQHILTCGLAPQIRRQHRALAGRARRARGRSRRSAGGDVVVRTGGTRTNELPDLVQVPARAQRRRPRCLPARARTRANRTTRLSDQFPVGGARVGGALRRADGRGRRRRTLLGGDDQTEVHARSHLPDRPRCCRDGTDRRRPRSVTRIRDRRSMGAVDAERSGRGHRRSTTCLRSRPKRLVGTTTRSSSTSDA